MLPVGRGECGGQGLALIHPRELGHERGGHIHGKGLSDSAAIDGQRGKVPANLTTPAINAWLAQTQKTCGKLT